MKDPDTETAEEEPLGYSMLENSGILRSRHKEDRRECKKLYSLLKTFFTVVTEDQVATGNTAAVSYMGMAVDDKREAEFHC